MTEYKKAVLGLPYVSLDECEQALKNRYAADYGDIPTTDYARRSHKIKYSISQIFLAMSELATCSEIMAALGGKKYRREAFERYLKNQNYMSVFYKL